MFISSFSDSGGEPNSGSVIELPADGLPQRQVLGGVNNLQNIAVDSAGDVFVTSRVDAANDANSSAVFERPAGGGALKTLISGIDNTAGVAVNSAGAVFVVAGDARRETPGSAPRGAVLV